MHDEDRTSNLEPGLRERQRMVISPPDAYIADTRSPRGRGVFARRDYAAGEIVERCPVIIIEQPFASLPGILRTIVFNWAALAKTGESSAIALGFGSMYNHDNPANMRYEATDEPHALVFSTVRPVAEGEELTINYNAVGGGPSWEDNHWFDRHGIKCIAAPAEALPSSPHLTRSAFLLER
ncbi:SET domain-containing protein [Sorangium sp. So ce1000]|uniref:SET domain-containing protein n=1 Tax=Sorangium sp. So ce1000 TaxID=3133325 RepID=UPI003F5F5073